MFALKLTIVPTGALIFRRVPFATTYFPTYPFVPPTTLSGYLRRLAMLAAGNAPPSMIEVKQRGKSLNDYAEFFVLPPNYVALGAFPQAGQYTIHRTKRHQPWGQKGDFEHAEFSALIRLDMSRTAQIPEWEYLLSEKFIGYVLHENADALAHLAHVKGWGCKLGKEGYAFVEDAFGPIALTEVEREEIPTTPIPARAVLGEPADIFTLYRYVWETDQRPAPDSAVPLPTNALKFQLFPAAWVRHPVKSKYYTDGREFIAVAWVKELQGVE